MKCVNEREKMQVKLTKENSQDQDHEPGEAQPEYVESSANVNDDFDHI